MHTRLSRWINCHFILLFSALYFIVFPGQPLAAEIRSSDSITNLYTGVFHPGRPTYVSASLGIEEDRDVLVDFLDRSGWYSGVRQTVKAGETYVHLSLELPTRMRDPATAYVSMKILPVGGHWTQKLAEINQRVDFVMPRPIRARLHFDYPLSWFKDPIGRGISNHDGVKVFVRERAGTYELGYFQSGYGSEEELILNLRSGDLFYHRKNSSNQTETWTLPVASLASDIEARNKYRTQLQKMKGTFEHVESGRMADMSADYPLLREANHYLRQALFEIAPVQFETIAIKGLHNSAGGPYGMTPRPGKKLALRVRYEAAMDRDLILLLREDGRFLSSERVKVPAGADTLVVPFQIPHDAPVPVSATFTASLVAQGASPESSLAIAQMETQILPLNNLDGIYVSEQVSSLNDLFISVNYSTVESLDLRVDLYDQQGHRLETIQHPLDIKETGSLYTLKFTSNHALTSDQTYQLVFQLVPPGSTDAQGFGEVVKFFKKRDRSL